MIPDWSISVPFASPESRVQPRCVSFLVPYTMCDGAICVSPRGGGQGFK